MEISFIQALLIGVIYYLTTNGNPVLGILGSLGFMRPIVCGTAVGLVLGDPVTGCVMGAAINLPYLAFMSAGGSQAMDPGLAGTLGTALGMAANVEPTVAITLAVPLGLLGTILWVAHMTINIAFVHMCDKAAEEGNLRKLNFFHFWPPTIVMILMSVVPVTIGAYYGVSALTGLIDVLSGKPLEVLSLIGGILPALGIAMNLRAMNGKGTLIFFFFGFLISGYSGMSIVGVSMFAMVIAYIFTVLYLKDGGTANGNS